MFFTNSHVAAARSARLNRIQGETYDEALRQFNEGGLPVKRGYKTLRMSPEEFLQLYEFRPRNLLRILDLSGNVETIGKYQAAQDMASFNRVKAHLEEQQTEAGN